MTETTIFVWDYSCSSCLCVTALYWYIVGPIVNTLHSVHAVLSEIIYFWPKVESKNIGEHFLSVNIGGDLKAVYWCREIQVFYLNHCYWLEHIQGANQQSHLLLLLLYWNFTTPQGHMLKRLDCRNEWTLGFVQAEGESALSLKSRRIVRRLLLCAQIGNSLHGLLW